MAFGCIRSAPNRVFESLAASSGASLRCSCLCLYRSTLSRWWSGFSPLYQTIIARHLAERPCVLTQQMAAWARGIVSSMERSAPLQSVCSCGLLVSSRALVFGFIAFLGEFVPMIGTDSHLNPSAFYGLEYRSRQVRTRTVGRALCWCLLS
jgi:hypothetical protein